MSTYQATQVANGNGHVATESSRHQDRRELLPEMGLKEYWYPALEAAKVKKKPVGRKICGVDLVFFRGADGEVKSLWNVCPHRGGSLMHGDCHYPGTISCPYHGWTFDGDGNVLAVLPEGPDSQVPGKVTARKYPTITLKGVVFVWMGEGEPVPPEEDIPPEMFDTTSTILYAEEEWPVNWRLMNENAGDAHASYVHRNALRTFVWPIPLTGPVSGRARTFPGKSTTQVSDRRKRAYRFYFPGQGWYWPKHQLRRTWTWVFWWARRRRAKSARWQCPEEWEQGHHLPSYTRINYGIFMHSRCAVPVTGNSLRNIYLEAEKPKSWIGRLYVRTLWRVWGRWTWLAFNGQDRKAVAFQRYDVPEYLSSTDNEVILWRKLVSKARGVQRDLADEMPETNAERFARERLEELGVSGLGATEPDGNGRERAAASGTAELPPV